MELSKENLETLEKKIKYSQRDSNLELEAVVDREISQAKFMQILQKIKQMRHHVNPEIQEEETLDITFADRYSFCIINQSKLEQGTTAETHSRESLKA